MGITIIYTGKMDYMVNNAVETPSIGRKWQALVLGS